MFDGADLPEFIQAITVGNLVTWLGLAFSVWLILKKMAPIVKKLADTLDDFHGEKERPGVPARPGIMERLGNQDKTLGEIAGKVETMSQSHITMLSGINELKGRADQNARGITRGARRTRRVEVMLMQHIHDSQIWIADLSRNAEAYNFKVPPWPVRSHEYQPNHDDNDDDADSAEAEQF